MSAIVEYYNQNDKLFFTLLSFALSKNRCILTRLDIVNSEVDILGKSDVDVLKCQMDMNYIFDIMFNRKDGY